MPIDMPLLIRFVVCVWSDNQMVDTRRARNRGFVPIPSRMMTDVQIAPEESTLTEF